MGLVGRIVVFSCVALVASVVIMFNQWEEGEPVPAFEKDVYWGPGGSHRDDETIREFKINVSDSVSI